ncbi:MAG: hypothetical protein ACYSTL_05600, partial [Planctomycetota bacterium]
IEVALNRPGSQSWLIKYLESESQRLGQMDVDKAYGIEILYCRRGIAGTLAELYGSERRSADVANARALEARLNKEISEIEQNWL